MDRPPWVGLLLLALPLLLASAILPVADGNAAIFKLRHKFPGRGIGAAALADLRAHDARRHGRTLSAVDLRLGGHGDPMMDGLYYAEIELGSPPNTYHVQVDTGSDILWVNCFSCKNCPTKTNLGFELRLYNPRESSSANVITCDDKFCSSTYGDRVEGCSEGMPCQYRLLYGDGSGTIGFFVSDNLQYNMVSGNMQTVPGNASVIFGCAAQQSGVLKESSGEAVDGILGFGQSNSSMLSQLSSSGKVRKMFAHCLDTNNGGGGIFAIGNVVQPKVKTTPLVPNQPHYNVNLKGIDVGGTLLQLPTDMFDTSDKTGTIIDSGTTLAYLPDSAHKKLAAAIFNTHQTLAFGEIEGFLCFPYTSSIDDGFPDVTFHFEDSLTLKVYPHDYLFEVQADVWCLGFQSSSSQSNGKQYVLLGDLVLSNRLVLYDLENQAIGWTEYNCSSSIKVQDDKTEAVYIVEGHNISSSPGLEMGKVVLFLLMSVLFHSLFFEDY